MEKLRIENKLAEIKKVNNMLLKLQDSWSLGDELVYDINLIFDELLSNVVFYAFDDEEVHHIEITISNNHDGLLEASIIDDGKEFDPTLFENSANKASSLDDIQPGRLGIHLVKTLVDSIVYERNNEHNILKFSILNKT